MYLILNSLKLLFRVVVEVFVLRADQLPFQARLFGHIFNDKNHTLSASMPFTVLVLFSPDRSTVLVSNSA